MVIWQMIISLPLFAATGALFETIHWERLGWKPVAGLVYQGAIVAGIAGSAFIAYMSSLTNTAYTATQYALFSSLFTLPGKFLGGFSGIIVDAAGYVTFFIYAGALGIPAILLVIYVMARSREGALGAEAAKG